MRWLLSSLAAGWLGLAAIGSVHAGDGGPPRFYTPAFPHQAIGPVHAGDGGPSRFYTPSYPRHGNWDRHPGYRYDAPRGHGHYHPGQHHHRGYGDGYPYRYGSGYPGHWYVAPRPGVYFNFGIGSGGIGF